MWKSIKRREAFASSGEGDKGELLTADRAPRVRLDDPDEFAKRFDNFMYGLMLAHMEHMPRVPIRKKAAVRNSPRCLEHKASIPQIKEKLPVLREIQTDAFWDANDILLFEQVRKELRELIKFLDEGGTEQKRDRDQTDGSDY